MVLGAIERGGDLRVTSEKRADRKTLHAFIKAQVSPPPECVMTDDFPAYEGIADG